MTPRARLRPAILASALGLGLLPLIGCIGASDDKLGSGYKAGTGAGVPNDGNGIQSTTQAERNDKGDNPQVGVGTGKPDSVDVSKTGGLGGVRDNNPPGPGATGARIDSPPTPPGPGETKAP